MKRVRILANPKRERVRVRILPKREKFRVLREKDIVTLTYNAKARGVIMRAGMEVSEIKWLHANNYSPAFISNRYLVVLEKHEGRDEEQTRDPRSKRRSRTKRAGTR